MQFGLGMVTILALLMTIGMGVVTWRLVREERRRSAARLAALAAELQRRQGTGGSAPTPAIRAATMSAAPIDAYIRPTASDAPAAPRPVIETPVDAPVAMFDVASGTGGWTQRMAGVAAAGLVLALVVSVAILAVPSPGSRHGSDPRFPVELVALSHENRNGLLAISGTVRNPADAPSNRQLSVLAMALDEAGTVVASSRAALALGSLHAGTESRFALTLPVEQASRYRISFLTGDTTVPHLDRRTDAATATAEVES